MNPNDQPQIQPDYSFITDQQNQSFQQPQKDNSFKIKLLILGGLFVVMMAGIGILATTTNKSVKETAKLEDVAITHIQLVANGKIAESKQYFTNASSMDDKIYELSWLPVTKGDYDLSKCQSVPVDASQESTTEKVFCPYKSKNTGQIFIYTLNDQTGLIEKIDYEKGDTNV